MATHFLPGGYINDDPYYLSPEEEIALQGGHACPDWDYLVIYPDDREMDGCTCSGIWARSRARTLNDIEDEDCEAGHE